MQDYSVISETVTTTGPGGITVGSGGSLAVKSGTMSVAGGPFSLASGVTQSLASGASLSALSGASVSLAAGANFIAPSAMVGAPGTASVSVATASGTTVPIAQGIVRVSATAATTSGSCTLAAGSLDGQQVTIINECASNFVCTGNLKANQTLAASSAMQLVWISADTAWWRLN